ncbi:hypothetical protein [Altererythrobacter sp.]|uniref:hypothetical protein n=1 Tax=Altererythrobacter sp. TaxID=1872480 RepID=UPI003CFF0B13
MENGANTRAAEAFGPIVAALETQISQLDELGAHVAAAHIDAAIHLLRFQGSQTRPREEV